MLQATTPNVSRCSKWLTTVHFSSVRRVLLVTVSLVCLAACERAELVRKMNELCAKDGGTRIFETVTLPADQFGSTGGPFEDQAVKSGYPLGPDYKLLVTVETLIGKGVDTEKGGGKLNRARTAIHRSADNKLLGERVTYVAVGGEGFTLGFPPSTEACPKNRENLLLKVFLKGK